MFKVLQFKGLSVLDQLFLEERLLRLDSQDWCILNEGSQEAIVMGISTKASDVISFEKLHQNPIPVIRRFSGGGTVYIDSNTLFVTFIASQERVQFHLSPERLLKWSEAFYQNVFDDSFSLKENDYVFSDVKFGGNAQYLKKNRFLHHTSFLWDYDPQKMEYLLLPKKRPAYRQDRSHEAFLTTLKGRFDSKEAFFSKVLETLSPFEKGSMAEVLPLFEKETRIATHVLSSEELKCV